MENDNDNDNDFAHQQKQECRTCIPNCTVKNFFKNAIKLSSLTAKT